MNKNDVFQAVKKAKIVDKKTIILGLCKDKTVLDVGCVGQDYSYNNPQWLHNQIRKVSSHVDGVDIVQEGIDLLKQEGFSIFHANELSKLNKKYDIILMSDVIEHVNDPVHFLEYYAEYLGNNGQILITTPNANGIRNFSSIIVRNDYSLNPEHTFWFCPKTITEVTKRAKLEFVDFFWLKEYFNLKQVKGFKQKIIFLFNSSLMKLRKNFCPNFLYIITRK